ncbi:hypothetical protein B0H63DRAFT_504294 [Podospora didyma]|uniref:Uncharacterized protein n=1 Tax=Podospora didyma TaxID=330526 RepID=A0AAE0K2K2_9PEZI|nr:hypothetical protein B0H63DRAFT_504294 [Podospora didyma]
MSVSSVKIYINMALEYLDSPYRVDDVEPNLLQAEQRLPNLSPADAAPLVAQIADIRAKLDNIVKPADARQVSAAQGKIRQARDYIDTNRGRLSKSDKEHVEDLFRIAVQFLDQISDASKADRLKAPVLAEIAQIRSQYGTDTSAPPPPPPPEKPATPPPPSQDYHNAKRAVFWANEYFTSPGRIDQVQPELAKAENFLKGDKSAEAAALAADIARMREKLADMVSPEDERYLSAAEGKLRQIRDHVDRNGGRVYDSDKQFIKDLCRGAVEFLDKITHPRKADELKAPVLAEISRIHAQYGINDATAPAATPPPPRQAEPQARTAPQARPPVDMNALSFEDQDRLNRARRVIGHARSNIESRRVDGVENLLFDATSVMAPVSEAHKRDLVDEMEQLRKDLEATRLSESTRRITSELDRKLSSVEMDVETPDRLQYSVISFKQRFEQDEVRQTLTPEMCRNYETRLANILAAGAAHVKSQVLNRAHPALQRLHDKLSTNPFTGLQQYEANGMDGELRSMRWQVEKEIKALPEDDADRLRIYKELEGTDAKFEAYSNEWAKAGIHESVKNGWQMILNEVQGWEEESLRPDAQPLEDPQMPQTRLAIHRVQYYLHGDSYVQRTRDENPGDSFIAAIDREAEQLLEAAGTKMASAFDRIMDAAERMETPISDRWLLGKPAHLITSAQGTFENTKFCEPVVSRIKALDQRWEDELAAVHKARENLGEKLSLEAVQKWPSIVAAIQPAAIHSSSFDPSYAKPGDAVHLSGVYNRSGWDFDGSQYGFSMRFNGVPLGGVYEPYINKALDHAAYELKLSIDDHKEWDVIGVVLGPGSIKERTKRTVRRGMYTEEIEEWLPIDCLRLRIVALRAGPVVVGPQDQ